MFPLSAENRARNVSTFQRGKLPKIRLPVDKTAVGPPGATFSGSGTLDDARPAAGPSGAILSQGRGLVPAGPWSSLSPDAHNLSAFRELCLGHRTAWLLAFVSDVWAGLRKSLSSASRRKMRLRRWHIHFLRENNLVKKKECFHGESDD